MWTVRVEKARNFSLLVFPFNAFLLSFYLQSNFATLDEKTGIVTSRRADRHFEEEGPILCAALDGMRLPSFPEYEVRVRCKFFLNAVTYWLIKTTRMCSNWIIWKFKLVTLPFFWGGIAILLYLKNYGLPNKLIGQSCLEWNSQLCC